MLDFTSFRALTFDCYGTLIDWEAGILSVLRPLLEARNVFLPDETLLENYAEFEAARQAESYCPYREVLRSVVAQFGKRYGFMPNAAEQDTLVTHFDRWQPFPDTVAALQILQRRFSLNIISNIDDDLFAITRRFLQTDFATVTTAQQVGSYKPSHRNFEAALERIGLPKAQVLHVAQSLFHDIAPARELGLTNVWVNRRGARHGFGATKPAQAAPDLEVPDLQTLAKLVEESDRSTAT